MRQKPYSPDKETDDEPTVLDTISQEELDNIIVALEALEFDDLGGLSEIEVPEEEPDDIGSVSQEDLDSLKEALEALEFDDLGGLTG